MERKSNAGRKKLPDTNKKKPVTIWVMAKFVTKAKKECLKIEEKYKSIV